MITPWLNIIMTPWPFSFTLPCKMKTLKTIPMMAWLCTCKAYPSKEMMNFPMAKSSCIPLMKRSWVDLIICQLHPHVAMRLETQRKRCRRMRKSEKKDKENVMVVSDESRLRVITRPKGGRRSLCMDLEEVKACRDTLSSFSNSTLDTSSGVTSPICCISSPGTLI